MVRSRAARQESLLPPRVEDYVEPDNPVRAIEGYVCALDLAKLGFRHAKRRGSGAGQPPYDPADLLKLYLYGYLNQIRSSRRLERESSRNLELIWLLKNLRPGYRTIANFRKENWAALKAANRSFVLLLKEIGLISGSVVAVDGALFHGNASKGSIFTQNKLTKQIAELDKEIEAYGKALEANDAAEAKQRSSDGSDSGSGGGDVGEKMKLLMARRERAKADLEELKTSDKGQISKTDPNARLLSKGDQTIAGYNVQSVVDDKHMLIIASEVVNRSDAGQLHKMAKAAKEALGVKTLQILADAGYFNSEDVKACEDDGVTAYVPVHEGNDKLKNQGRFTRKDFTYDARSNTYCCPAKQLLRPTKTPVKNVSGRIETRYLGSKATCGACSLQASCLGPKAKYRTVFRWEHEIVLDRLRQRMASEDAGKLMRRRSAIVEHPFGTLKCRAGYRHFLVRGFDKVGGEWSLMALSYNFARVINILGFNGFLARIAEWALATLRATSREGRSAWTLILLPLTRFRAKISLSLEVAPRRAHPAL
ncbi:IS1182 family transposase [Bradyrhizobium sp. HKCCYLS1011]|uniref:IS1182 family transposase n=1 Tax=Bradyrhizobium sp. HKCCYLS1011 TaxID=3420733 RepID=UPI003EC0B7F2